MIDKYLPRLLAAGPYFETVLLKDITSARTFLGAFRTRLKALDVTKHPFKEFWFKTADGVVLSISGPLLVIQLFKMFIAEFDGHYFKGFTVLHSSHGPMKFEKAVRELFLSYRPSKGSHQRCYGGSY
jgi:hypothetical protein